MKQNWTILEHPLSKEIEQKRESEKSERVNEFIKSLSFEELRELAFKQNDRLRDKQKEIDTLGHIASSAHWYLSEPKLAKKDLIESLIKSGFWMPRIKYFKDCTPYSFKVESYHYLVSAVNDIGETQTYGILIERDNYISFSVWIDERIPIKYWNVYQISALVPPPIDDGKFIMKLPFVKSKNGSFKFKLFGPAYTGESHFFSAKQTTKE